MTKDAPAIAMLIANGFDEVAFTTLQKVMIKQGFATQVVSPESAVVNGWTGQGWGCFFPVDVPVNQALAADFDALIVPGGSRALEKLMKTAHTRRIFESFVRSQKPVLLCGDEAIYDELFVNLTNEEKETLLRSVENSAEDLQKQCSAFIKGVVAGADEMSAAA